MESRLFVLFLSKLPLLALGGCLLLLGGCSVFQQSADEAAEELPPVIDPEVERRDIKVPKIDSENFEVGLYGGLMSIEDFGSDSVVGARVAFHATEDFFLEAVYAQTQAGRTSFEELSGAVELLTPEERDYTYYNLSLGYNVLPGEAFLGQSWAFNTALYAIAGVGSTEFAGDDRFTINAGFGYRVILNDFLALHLDVRDHLFDIDLLGEEKTTHNIEYHFGFTIFF
ncbi:MAG: outer membrane beta-barrel domain-containing protein [Pseudomonadota bacterium]